LASENGVAGILCASVVVKASDVGVNTSSCWNATIGSANTVIVAVSSVEGNVVTSSGGAAIVVSAGISVIAINSGVSAETSVNVTSVKGASVATCTIERSWVTMSIGVVAGIDLAVDGGTGNVEASVARNQGVNTSSCGVASVCSARIAIITVDQTVNASTGRVASGGVALVGRSADKRSSCASSCWVAAVHKTEVSIAADSVGVCASVSSKSESAGSNQTLVCAAARRWADTSCRAGAESFCIQHHKGFLGWRCK